MKLTFKQALVLLHYLQLDIPDSVMELAEIPEDFYFPSAKVIAKYPDRRKDGLKIIEYLRAVADALEEGIKE